MSKKDEKRAKDAVKAIVGAVAGEIIWHFAKPKITKLLNKGISISEKVLEEIILDGDEAYKKTIKINKKVKKFDFDYKKWKESQDLKKLQKKRKVKKKIKIKSKIKKPLSEIRESAKRAVDKYLVKK
tara:strand:- start:52 stop:432 length:381 start_codon:yes stop_codon:yes gene_type:complete